VRQHGRKQAAELVIGGFLLVGNEKINICEGFTGVKEI
jgi:hypothetical protein